MTRGYNINKEYMEIEYCEICGRSCCTENLHDSEAIELWAQRRNAKFFKDRPEYQNVVETKPVTQTNNKGDEQR